jgi:hypothetical protein
MDCPPVCTVLLAAASRPLWPKFGFCFSTGASPFTTALSVSKASFWEGSGPLDRWNGFGDRSFRRLGDLERDVLRFR